MARFFFTLAIPFCLTFSSLAMFAQEKPILVDVEKRVLKTYDGSVYREYDTLGRLIAHYGSWNTDDSDGNFYSCFLYDVSGKLIRERDYYFGQDSINMTTTDSLNCIESVFIYKGKRAERQVYNPVIDADGNIVGQKLKETIFPSSVPYIRVPKFKRTELENVLKLN